MSLQYIIDGYNIIHHPIFRQSINNKIKDTRSGLLELLRIKRLSGSSKNKITVVFDGHSGLRNSEGHSDNDVINIIFSRKESADERIKKMVENSSNPKVIVVVSDDNQIRLFVSSIGARVMDVEEFMRPKEKRQKNKDASWEAKVTYRQAEKINQELRKIWLK